MKKFSYIILVSISILFTGCGANPTRLMSDFTEKTPIGMPENEFKEMAQDEVLVFSDKDVTIYKLTIKTFNYFQHWRKSYRFFYFRNHYLEKIDTGERAVDYRIKIE